MHLRTKLKESLKHKLLTSFFIVFVRSFKAKKYPAGLTSPTTVIKCTLKYHVIKLTKFHKFFKKNNRNFCNVKNLFIELKM